jgi:hypothetical protein
MLIFININLYICSCEIYIIVRSCDYLYSFCVVCPLLCSFVHCVSFDRGVILCDVRYLFVVSYCKPLPPGKNPFAVNKYYNTLHSSEDNLNTHRLTRRLFRLIPYPPPPPASALKCIHLRQFNTTFRPDFVPKETFRKTPVSF